MGGLGEKNLNTLNPYRHLQHQGALQGGRRSVLHGTTLRFLQRDDGAGMGLRRDHGLRCVSPEDGAGEVRIAFADPPYIGQAHRYAEKTEVDHSELIGRLISEYPDGWALSLSSPSQYEIEKILEEKHGLHKIKGDYRVGVWVKPFAVFKPNVNPGFAWEPVIFRGGRKERSRTEPTVRDWVSVSVTLQRGMVGAKPDEFCFWVFQFLGLRACDTLDDLYYGSGAVTRAWEAYKRQSVMDLSNA